MAPLVVLVAVLALGTFLDAPARACAPAPRPGDTVFITDEEAVIVWDAASRTEHFIRHARFDASLQGGPDFGFLVPTPGVPTLTETSEAIFADLADESKPQVVDQDETGARLGCLCLGFFARKSAVTAAAPPEPVRILSTQTVAGYDAVVLEAADPKALAGWLGSHGYESRPALIEWLKPYLAHKWKLTAFKIAAGAGDAQGRATVGSSAVRMSFTTDAPFFPYREPFDLRTDATGARTLRVYFVASSRMSGTLGATGSAWPAETEYARPLERIVPLSRALPGELLPSAPWLTVFLDRSSPRVGSEDVYFAPSTATNEIRPPPTVVMHDRTVLVPVDILGVALAGIAVAAFFVRGYTRGRR